MILRGVNLAGNSKVPPFLPLPTGDAVAFRTDRGGSMVTRDFDFLGNTSFQALDALPSWGMNVIRLLLVWEAYEPVRGERSLAYIEMLKAIANEAWRRGIYTIIDFHQNVFARWVADGCGEGFPRWTLPSDADFDAGAAAQRRVPVRTGWPRASRTRKSMAPSTTSIRAGCATTISG